MCHPVQALQKLMARWMDRWVDGLEARRMDGWMDEWMDDGWVIDG